MGILFTLRAKCPTPTRYSRTHWMHSIYMPLGRSFP